MKDITLVIMAAGIGSRFGGGIKQLTPVGPSGELIIDYSVKDALAAGFSKVVFIIRKSIEQDFKEMIGDRISKICPVSYVFQELEYLPEGFHLPKERTKPWGTGQAVLVCKDIVKEPFAIINADDYYGKKAFEKMHDFLVTHHGQTGHYCMAGFQLKNTLSENGGVTRGVCEVDGDSNLVKVTETQNIRRQNQDSCVDGEGNILDQNTFVSMNMWGVTPDFFEALETGFQKFLSDLKDGDIKAEFLLPTIIDGLLKKGDISVKLLSTEDSWFGITYAEDKDSVKNAFQELVTRGEYSSPLFQ